MDDAGEMSAWYVFAAMGIYPYSPADADYIISVPLFDKIELSLDDNQKCTIGKENSENKITNISYNHQNIDGYFISHTELFKGKSLVITTK